jgi:hypothetical protein
MQIYYNKIYVQKQKYAIVIIAAILPLTALVSFLQAQSVAAQTDNSGGQQGSSNTGSSQTCGAGEHASPTGVCCPKGTTAVHSFCLTPDELEQKNQQDARIENCAIGAAKGGIVGGTPGAVMGALNSCR